MNMASVPQQMQPNMVFAAPQMTTGPQGQLLLTTGQPMTQQMGSQIGPYIQTSVPTTGFYASGPNQYFPVNYGPVVVNNPFQTGNHVQNLAIQIPNGNSQQLIATTPTQMNQPQQAVKNQQKGGQQQGSQSGMVKTPVSGNKTLHPSGQVNQNQQQQQQQQQSTLIQQTGQAYFVAGGQTFVQATPPQNQTKKNNNINKASNKNSASKPIQIQSQIIQQSYKPANGMQQANIQATPIQFANTNQQLMFSPMQTTQTIWSQQPVQQSQFITAQPQQVLLRSPQGDQTAMLLQQAGQSQFQTMPVQLAQQANPQQQQNTPTMQQPVIQVSNGPYTQVTAATPSTPTKSTVIQPKIQHDSPTKSSASKPQVKLAPNTTVKSESSAVKLAPKVPTSTVTSVSSGTSIQTTLSVNQKSIGTNPPRTSFGMNIPTGPPKPIVRSAQTNTSTPSTRTVNTQVSKKIGNNALDKRSQATDNPTLSNNKKEDSKSKSDDVLTHYIDGFLVFESTHPFPCDGETENVKNNNPAKIKDLKSEQKENITQIPVNNSKPKLPTQSNDVQKNVNEKKNDKIQPDAKVKAQQDTKAKIQPETKVKATQNGVKFSPIASKPIVQNGQPANKTTTSVSKSVSIGNPLSSGVKRAPPKTNEFKPPEKKPTLAPAEEVPVNGKSESKENISNLWTPSNEKTPRDWTIDEVCDFVSHIDGCAQFAEEFRSQEIDGQALMLIKEKHIVEILNTKWGMALKIFRKIEELKTAFNIS